MSSSTISTGIGSWAFQPPLGAVGSSTILTPYDNRNPPVSRIRGELRMAWSRGRVAADAFDLIRAHTRARQHAARRVGAVRRQLPVRVVVGAAVRNAVGMPLERHGVRQLAELGGDDRENVFRFRLHP